MNKKKEEKVNLGVSPTLKKMRIGDVEMFPISQMNTVKTTASTIKLLEKKVFKTKQFNETNQIRVTRIQ